MANAWKISFCNLKGGVGKTTLAVQFAYFLSLHRKKVLLIDSDYQGNSTSNLIPSSSGEDGTTVASLGYRCTRSYELFNKITPSKNPRPIELTDYLHLIPSDVADVDLVRCSFLPMETSLNVAENIKALHGAYDFIIFDCPPSLGTAVAGPLIASDRLIAPVVLGANFRESILSIRSTVDAVRSIAPNLKLLGYVVNRLPRKSQADSLLYEQVKAWLGNKIIDPVIHDWLTILRAGQTKRTVFGLGRKEAQAELAALFDNILQKLGEKPLGMPGTKPLTSPHTDSHIEAPTVPSTAPVQGGTTETKSNKKKKSKTKRSHKIAKQLKAKESPQTFPQLLPPYSITSNS